MGIANIEPTQVPNQKCNRGKRRSRNVRLAPAGNEKNLLIRRSERNRARAAVKLQHVNSMLAAISFKPNGKFKEDACGE